MVAIFKTGSSIATTLNYNERKVQKGVAECIMAENYPIDHDKLTFSQKLARLENQASLNANVSRNSVHISLNFDPSETLEVDKLKAIASAYMQQIGFGEQPFLVYRHFDAGHPHVHIVSVKIDAAGNRIDTQNIGKNQSEKARKNIEISFGLLKAEDSEKNEKYRLEPVSVAKVKYGKTETKKAINTILSHVLNSYKYGSLHELNALLKLYNVTAERGSETSRMYKGKGLMFRALDERGNRIGAPIKASQFYMKPTLTNLETKFLKNAVEKHGLGKRITTAINAAFFRKPQMTLQALIAQLDRNGISTVLRQNEQGRVYGITYIDHKNRVVFNGSELGNYSVKAIQERCEPQRGLSTNVAVGKTSPGTQPATGSPVHHPSVSSRDSPPSKDLLDILLQPELVCEPVPYQLRKTRKKKRKRPSNNN